MHLAPLWKQYISTSIRDFLPTTRVFYPQQPTTKFVVGKKKTMPKSTSGDILLITLPKQISCAFATRKNDQQIWEKNYADEWDIVFCFSLFVFFLRTLFFFIKIFHR